MNPRPLRLFFSMVICSYAVACSSEAPFFDNDGGTNVGCEPGETQPCECTDTGMLGVQTCDEHGVWIECHCADPDPCGDGVVWVIDRSRSMSSTVSKWSDFMDALQNVINHNDNNVPMGLVMFPDDTCDPADDQNPENQCTAPDLVDVSVGLGKGQSVWNTLDDIGTCGGTPTAVALEVALQAVQISATELQIILITDGLPNCNFNLDPLTCECIVADCTDMPYHCLDSDNTIAAAEALYHFGAPVHVFAYDVETELMEFMDALAEAGGSGQAVCCGNGTDMEISLSQFFNTIVDC